MKEIFSQLNICNFLFCFFLIPIFAHLFMYILYIPCNVYCENEIDKRIKKCFIYIYVNDATQRVIATRHIIIQAKVMFLEYIPIRYTYIIYSLEKLYLVESRRFSSVHIVIYITYNTCVYIVFICTAYV